MLFLYNLSSKIIILPSLPHVSLKTIPWGRHNYLSILQMKQVRLGGAKQCAQGRTVALRQEFSWIKSKLCIEMLIIMVSSLFLLWKFVLFENSSVKPIMICGSKLSSKYQYLSFKPFSLILIIFFFRSLNLNLEPAVLVGHHAYPIDQPSIWVPPSVPSLSCLLYLFLVQLLEIYFLC